MINKKRTVTGACELFFVRLSHQCNNKTIRNNCSLNYLLRLWCRCQCTRFHTTSCCVYLKRLSDTPVILLNKKPLFRKARTIPTLNYFVCTRRKCHMTVWTLSIRNCIRLKPQQNKTPCHMVWQVTNSVFHNMKAWYLHKDYITLSLSLNGLKNIATFPIFRPLFSASFCEERVSFPTSQKNSLSELFSKHNWWRCYYTNF